MQSNAGASSTEPQIKLKRRILSLKGICIGLIAGLLAVGFRLSLEFAEKLRNAFITFSLFHGYFYLLGPALLFGLLVAMVVFVTSRFAPDAGGSGIPHLKGYLDGFWEFRATRILLVKFFGGVIGIGSGLALGREGPTVQMGSAIAKILGNHMAPNKVERRILISAGAGAGLAAAFNAPLAGIFFVIEELQGNLNQVVLVTAFAACVTADVVCRIITGELPVFHVSIAHYPTVDMIPFFLLLGVLLGTVGLLFNRTLLRAVSFFRRMNSQSKTTFALCFGVILGIVGLFLPDALGTGTLLLEHIFNNKVALYQIFSFFVLRFVFTMLSYGSGAPGGIFAPLLLLGVLAGSFCGYIFLLIHPEPSFDFSAWGILGMAGLFSAIVRAPITGTVLILEMTSAYSLLLPLMVVSITAYGVPEYFKDKPIYEALLQRDLSYKSLTRTNE